MPEASKKILGQQCPQKFLLSWCLLTVKKKCTQSITFPAEVKERLGSGTDPPPKPTRGQCFPLRNNVPVPAPNIFKLSLCVCFAFIFAFFWASRFKGAHILPHQSFCFHKKSSRCREGSCRMWDVVRVSIFMQAVQPLPLTRRYIVL